MGTDTSENATLIEAAKFFGAIEMLDIPNGDGGDIRVLSVPTGRAVVPVKTYLDQYLKAPERRRGTARITTLDSFIAHVVRHKDADSAVFADVGESQAELVAVFDYNLAGPIGARFGEHRASYACPYSDEWKAWTAKRSEMSVADFAQFLEDRIMDVLAPDAAGETVKDFAEQLSVDLASPQKLMELSRGLTVNVGQKVVNNVNLSTGEARISFEEKHAGDGESAVKVPGAFALAIPVFRNGDLFQVPVRLRYRAAGGQITWSFSPQRTDRIREFALRTACEQVAGKTGLPLFYGKPEA